MANNRKSYSFKSVGQKQDDFFNQQLETIRKTPIGIVTPISFALAGDTMFNMSYDIAAQIRDNLKNLLLTNSGERLMLNDFGANLRPLAFELTNDDVAAEATRRILASVNKYMPFVELDTFETVAETPKNENIANVTVKVTYSVPSIGVINQAVEAVIYAAG